MGGPWVWRRCWVKEGPRGLWRNHTHRFSVAVCFREEQRGEPYRYELPYGGGGSYPGVGGPQGWHPDLPPLHPHHGGHPLQGR